MKKLILLSVLSALTSFGSQRFDSFARSDMVPNSNDLTIITNSLASLSNRTTAVEAYTNRAATAIQTELDPDYHAGTNAIYEAIAAASYTNFQQDFNYNSITNPPDLTIYASTASVSQVASDLSTETQRAIAAEATKLGTNAVVQTLSGNETDKVPSVAAVNAGISTETQRAIDAEEGLLPKTNGTAENLTLSGTNTITGLTNAADTVKITYTGGVLIFKEVYGGVTNTYNSLNN
jgi:hypothetical protein